MMQQGLRVVTLYSGSRGNSIYIRAGDTRLLFDAGLNCSALCRALREIGELPELIDAVYITHEHKDHISALDVFQRRYPVTVHMAEPTAEAVHCVDYLTVRHAPLFSVSERCCEVSSFITPHDSRMSIGYIIRTDYGNVGIATDLGTVTEEIAESLAYCDSVVLESNHDVEMLRSGPYPPALKARILSDYGHLSNDVSSRVAAYLASCGTKNIILAHLSEHNNTPELAYAASRRALDEAGYSFVRLEVADSSKPTVLI